MKTVKVTVEVPVGADGRALMLRLARALMREARGTEKTKNAGWGKGVLAYARSIGVSRQRVGNVLSGRESGKRILEGWERWQAERALRGE